MIIPWLAHIIRLSSSFYQLLPACLFLPDIRLYLRICSNRMWAKARSLYHGTRQGYRAHDRVLE